MSPVEKENPMMNGTCPRRASAGFTLLEVMITVVIVGILAAVALPSYSQFVTRSRIVEATNALSDLRAQQEKWFMDRRDYTDGGGKCGIESTPIPDLVAKYNADPANKFQIACAAPSATTYTLTATGTGPMAGFSYDINQLNAKTTAGLPAGWTTPTPNSCWALRKDGSCS
jgi:type IV pilus assembly protein PilE